MIEIILVRHGIAAEREEWDGGDVSRPLTEKGRSRMRRAAEGLHAVVSDITGILTSPYTRARETAEILYEVFGERGLPKPEVAEQLGCGGYRECMQLVPTFGRHIFVGHEPDLRCFAASLCQVSPHAIEPLKKGGTLCIKKSVADTWLISWYFQPRHLRMMS